LHRPLHQPAGYHALTLYKSLRPLDSRSSGQAAAAGPSGPSSSSGRPAAPSASVQIARGVRYGQQPRNTMDVYVPASAVADTQAGLPASRRVVLFCHGGVWAAGETWHYAPMAVQLAKLGVVTCIMQYTVSWGW